MGLVNPGGGPLRPPPPQPPDVDIVNAFPITVMVYPVRRPPVVPPAITPAAAPRVVTIAHWPPTAPLEVVISSLHNATALAERMFAQQQAEAGARNGQVPPVEPPAS